MPIRRLHPVAGRDPLAAARVAVYKNLRKGAWSIRALDGPHKGKVTAHAEVVAIADCVFHVGAAARSRIAGGAPREVHAWVAGRITDIELAQPQRISYRPRERGEFFIIATGAAIWSASAVVFTDAAYIETERE